MAKDIFDGSTKTTVCISHKQDDLDEIKGLIGLLEKKYNIKAYIDSWDKSMPKNIFQRVEILAFFFEKYMNSVYAKNDAFTQMILKYGIKWITMQATCCNG